MQLSANSEVKEILNFWFPVGLYTKLMQTFGFLSVQEETTNC